MGEVPYSDDGFVRAYSPEKPPAINTSSDAVSAVRVNVEGDDGSPKGFVKSIIQDSVWLDASVCMTRDFVA